MTRGDLEGAEFEIGGVRVTVVPDEGLAERMASERGLMVCVPATDRTPFRDNALGSCVACERGVQYRPYMPASVAKACVGCAASMPARKMRRKVEAHYERAARKPTPR